MQHHDPAGHSVRPATRLHYFFLPSLIIMVAIVVFNVFQHVHADRKRLLTNATTLVQQQATVMHSLLLAYTPLQCSVSGQISATPPTSASTHKTLPNHSTDLDQLTALTPSLEAIAMVTTTQPLVYVQQMGPLLDHNHLLTLAEQPDSPLLTQPYRVDQQLYLQSWCHRSGQSYRVISRHSLDRFRGHILPSGNPGITLRLIDTLAPYAESHRQISHPPTSPLVQQAIPGTHWSVVAFPLPEDLKHHLTGYLLAPLLLILILISSVWAFRRSVQQAEQAATQADTQRQQAEERANRVLQSIEDALISTDANGEVNYVNHRASELLAQNGYTLLKGHTLAAIWPHPQALWAHGLSVQELAHLHDKGRTLTASLDGESRIMEQSHYPLYRDQQLDGIVWILRDISTSVHTLRELERSRQRYMSLFEESGVAHWLLDIAEFHNSLDSLSIINVNQAAIALAGASSRSQLQRQFRQLFTDDRHAFLDAVQQSRQEQSRFTHTQVAITRFDGQQRELSIHFSPGFEHKLMVSLIDVTEEKRAAERAREQENFWAAVMAAMPDTVFVADLDDQLEPAIIYRNRSGSETLGYPALADNDGCCDWLLYASDEEKQRCHQALTVLRTLPPGKAHIICLQCRHHDGSTRLIRFELTPFRYDQNGNVNSYIGTARDVTDDRAKQQQTIESEARYRMVAENMTDVIWATDSHMKLNFVSTSVHRLLGYQPDELLKLGIDVIFSLRDIRSLQLDLRQALQTATNNPDLHHNLLQKDIQATTRDGERRLLNIQASMIRNPDGSTQGITGICRDVTEERRNEQELLLAADVFENTNEAIIVADDNFRVVKVNRSFTQITGFPAHEIIGKTPDHLVAPEHRNNHYMHDIIETLVVDNYWQGELKYRCMSGETRTSWTGISIIRDPQHEIQSLTIIMSDITERKANEERIHHLAYYDPLTGLANRAQMHERLEALMHKTSHHNSHLSLLFIDLDRFKPINDSLGHPAGDKVLIEVAERLRQCVKSGDMVCRMGGDEFTIGLAFDNTNHDVVTIPQRVAERILKELNQPYYIGKHQLFLSASIGIATYPNDGDSVIELLKNADMAMYHAKDAGRNNLQFYNAAMNRQAVERMELENDLHQVLQKQELYLLFQPQYDSRTLRAVGVEALLRWHHPVRGEVLPQEFVPILEDTGLIGPVGCWVLEQACLKMAGWLELGLSIQLIAVNVSARQFKYPGFVDEVKQALQKSGISPHHLELELTESALIDDIDFTLSVLHELRALGVRISIDDFGTGYSSLNYLKQFPVDILKVDRSFIQNLPTNRDDAQITRTIIAMAHNLGLGVIAEGIENCEQLAFLIEARCETLQGYLLSVPVTADELEARMTDQPVCSLKAIERDSV
ncbi:EAL domain-containing protein [Oceanobacter sp. 5_MG-2023]|uniref:sensor domain-containing protein n=1 Tax=Oceanobacter sp. 5_MG-2023 TaxID=3062645 RepID=UPI0026E33203|nr:EAL domain-containing protein [Oceanobacter sp. 5_MG-2023]MDO6681950.1 EAL domain-containing protein [Oceanobacter sp. 5_MG-2023]